MKQQNPNICDPKPGKASRTILADLTPLALPAIKVFAFKANKRYDCYNNHLTTQLLYHLTNSEIITKNGDSAIPYFKVMSVLYERSSLSQFRYE